MSKIIESLKEIGFNTYEARVYVALLKKYPATGYEISKLSEVPQARTYDTLNVLAQRGVVTAGSEKPVKYTPIKPKELVKSYKKRMTSNIDYLEKHLPEVSSQCFEPVLQISEEEHIYSKVRDMINASVKEVYLEVWAKDFKRFENELLNAYNRNVEIRIVSYEKISTNFGLVYEHPFAKRIESSIGGRNIALVCDETEALYGKTVSFDGEGVNVVYTKNESVVSLIKEFITHDMMLLDIQMMFPKELMYTYGTGMKHLHDKILGSDNIYKVATGNS